MREIADLLDNAGLGDVASDASGALDDFAGPTMLPTRAALSTPFWNVKTVAPFAGDPQALRGAFRVAHLHREDDRIGRRHLARIGDSVDRLQMQRPMSLSSRRPSGRIASRCAPRAMNVTSLPDAARRAPK